MSEHYSSEEMRNRERQRADEARYRAKMEADEARHHEERLSDAERRTHEKAESDELRYRAEEHRAAGKESWDETEGYGRGKSSSALYRYGPPPEDPDEIERELAETRAEMEETLDALAHKLSPEVLIQEGIEFLRGPGEFASNLSESVKRNPLPATLAGIGLGWLIFASQHPPSPRESSHRMEGLRQRGVSSASHVRERGSESLDELESGVEMARERASSAAHRVGDRMSEIGRRFRHRSEYGSKRAHEVSEDLSHRTMASTDEMSRMYKQQPLVFGALAIAVGALIGASMPTSKKERQTFGKAGEKAMEKGEHEASKRSEELSEKAREKTRQAGEAARERTRQVDESLHSSPGGESYTPGGDGHAPSPGERH